MTTARALFVTAAVALLLSPTAAAGSGKKVAGGGDVQSLLAAVEAAGATAAGAEAANKVIELSPAPAEALAGYLERTRKSTDAERREVLTLINASMPDEKGRFKTPRRQTEEEKAAADSKDWLAELAGHKKKGVAAGEVMADIAVIRALAGSQDHTAATPILDFAFTDDGAAYRDEVGRYLRKMAPWCLPTLIRASQNRKNSSRRRYALYQLERLDRENPNKALRYTHGDLQLEVIKAFADSQYRLAIYPLLQLLDHRSPELRRAARQAWNQLLTTKPRNAPKKKLVLPGGKLSDKPEPMWLNTHELAAIELRKALEQVTGKKTDAKATPLELTAELLSLYDKRREDAFSERVDKAISTAETDVAAGAALASQILAVEPNHPRRGELAGVFFSHGEQLEKQEKWPEAAAAYASAYGAAPTGSRAKEAQAKQAFARGKILEAEGIDATAEFEAAREGGVSSGGKGGASWMLYGGVGGGALGLVLMVLGFVRRR